MKGQKCANCGYRMKGEEALLNIAGNVLGNIFGNVVNQPISKSLVGTNTASNITKLKCPKYGQVGRWVRDDE